MSRTMPSLKWGLLDLIKECKNSRSFKQIHTQLITSGLVHNELFTNKVVEFFVRFDKIGDCACDFLKQVDWRLNSYPFNRVVYSYIGSNIPQVAVLVYRRIVRDGFVPDFYTFPGVLKSCAKFSGIKEGGEVHGVIVKMGFLGDLYVQNSLVHFYSACGDFVGAGTLFDEMLVRDVVSWTGLISGYVRSGLFNEAVSFFLRMDMEPNLATLVSVLTACGRMGYLHMGKGVHGLISKLTFMMDLTLGNAIIDMYVKNECLSEAKKMFDELPERDIISWTIMITGLVQCKYPKEALELFSKMQTSGISADRIILTSILSACASLGTLDYGRWVHEYIDRMGIDWDIHIGTAMVHMYAKCGCIKMALLTFNQMPCKNVFTWNALLGGLAKHGDAHQALEHFEQMLRFGPRPNEVTFLAILTACCHAGLVEEGRKYFNRMKSQYYNLCPRLEHYGCMVDLLCKAGLLNEALELIKTMPMNPDVMIWGALLTACKSVGNIELSQHILERISELESCDSGVYVLVSNIYASNGKWGDVKRVRRLMKDKGVKKAPGSSVIEVDGEAHEFLVRDTSHPRSEDICRLLNLINYVYLEGEFSHQLLIQ